MKIFKYFTFLALLFCTTIVVAQVRFVADANAKTTVLNSYFDVTFTLENANGNSFSPPPFKNFQVVAGPSRSSQTTIVNGKATQKLSYSYTLQPKKVGTFSIGAASIVAKGKKLTTKNLSVKVVEGKKTADGAPVEDEYFVRTELSVTDAYIGQQVIVDFKLYTAVNIDSYNVLSEPEYAGFYAQDIKRYNSTVQKEVIDGVQYTTKILKRVALFPQQAGQLIIEPVRIQLGLLVGDPRQRRSFFSSSRVRRVPVNTEEVRINVRSLPSDAPPYFTGAVGQYDVGMSVDQNNISTDDVVTVRLVVNGNGDTKRISPPPFNLPVDSFEIYEPRTLEENTAEKQSELNGQKIFEYLILPKYPGNFKLQPSFTYFDTDSLRYITLNSNPYPINVKQGTRKKNTAPIIDNSERTADIRFIKLETTLEREATSFFGSKPFWILTFLPFLVLGGAAVYRQMQEKENSVDAVTRKRLQAQKLAQKRLKTAEVHLKSNDSRAFYDEISRALFGYVCDKLDIPLAELSKNNVRSKLEGLDVNPNYIEDVMKIIKTCETALFAGMDNSAAMQETYGKTLGTVTNIEAEIE
ncbi:MAG: BatD family protein [Saprospiraceae bacterium]